MDWYKSENESKEVTACFVTDDMKSKDYFYTSYNL